MPAKYRFKQIDHESFELHEDGFFLLKFKRQSFRTDFETFAERYGRSSNWIGAILRLFLASFPPSQKTNNTSSTLSDFQKEHKFITALKERGYFIYKDTEHTEIEMVNFLEARGFTIKPLNQTSPHMMSGALFSRN